MVEFFQTSKGMDLERLTTATLSKLEEIKEKTATGMFRAFEQLLQRNSCFQTWYLGAQCTTSHGARFCTVTSWTVAGFSPPTPDQFKEGFFASKAVLGHYFQVAKQNEELLRCGVMSPDPEVGHHDLTLAGLWSWQCYHFDFFYFIIKQEF